MTIEPGDSIMMDCILSGYLNYTYEDREDTLYVYNNGVNPYAYLKIKIDYYEDYFYSGTLQGNISSDGSPVSNRQIFISFTEEILLLPGVFLMPMEIILLNFLWEIIR